MEVTGKELSTSVVLCGMWHKAGRLEPGIVDRSQLAPVHLHGIRSHGCLLLMVPHMPFTMAGGGNLLLLIAGSDPHVLYDCWLWPPLPSTIQCGVI